MIESRLIGFDAGQPDPVLQYGFLWANALHDLYVHASEAIYQAEQIEAGREVNPGYVFAEFEHMGTWFDKYDSMLGVSDRYPIRPDEPDAP